jgi:hypothetical protein
MSALRKYLRVLAGLALASCSGGGVSPCIADQSCAPSDAVIACKTYATTCTGTQALCAVVGNAPDGSGCGPADVCSNGACVVACTPSQSCMPAIDAEPCTIYTTSCSANLTNTVCAASGDAVDGTNCGVGLACHAGACLASARTVSGVLQTLYTRDDGTQALVPGWPLEMTGANLTALVIPDESTSGYTTIAVTPGADGSFSVTNVPGRNYFIQVDVPSIGLNSLGETPLIARSLYETNLDHPDLTILVHGRPDRVLATQPTTVTFDITNLSPRFANSSNLKILSPQAGVFGIPIGSLLSPRVAAGATSILSALNWEQLGFLPDATKGDVTYFYERDFTVLQKGGSQGFFSFTSRYAANTTFSVADGSPATFSAALIDAPQTGNVSLNILSSKFAALSSAVNPSAVPSAAGVSLLALAPGGTWNLSLSQASLPVPLQLTSLMVLGDADPSNDIDFGPLTYGRFLSDTWQEALSWSYEYDISAAAGNGVLFGEVYSALMPVPSSPILLAPIIGPPLAPMIDGADAFLTQTGVGQGPTLSWSAPALGSATQYNITLSADQDPGVQAGEVATLTVSLYSRTSFTVPAGFLHAGRRYRGNITAINSPQTIDSPPLQSFLPIHQVGCDFVFFTP